MSTQIAPMLAVSDTERAIEFYKDAFGATELWRLMNGPHGVAGLSIQGAPLFLASESPTHGTRSPDIVGHTTVRIELFVDDPYEVHQHAVTAGCIEKDPVQEHQYPVVGPSAFTRMVQSRIVDPFGHIWLIGKILE